MNKKIKGSVHFFSVFFLTTTVLAGLFFVLDMTFRPLPAAAKNLQNNTFAPANQEPSSRFTPPSLFLLQTSSAATTYLPSIYRSPSVVYFDNFSNSKSGWPSGDDGKCNSFYDANRYRLDVDADEECFRFAPKAAERTYGWFEAEIYHSEGQSNAAYGFYLNGNGGDNYYLFRISPNNGCSSGGGWEFIRKRNGSETTLLSVGCDTSVKRGYGTSNANILRVQHNAGAQIVLFINGIQVAGAFNDALELTGVGTGVYARATSSPNIIVKVIDFTVILP